MNTSSRLGCSTVALVMSSWWSRSAMRTSAASLASAQLTLNAEPVAATIGVSPVRLGSQCDRLRRVGALDQLDAEARGADLGLELGGGALGDLPAAIDDGDPVGQRVGLVEVLGGQQDRGSLGDQVADRVPHLAAVPGVEAGRGLVEEDQCGPGDQAGREIEAAAHAAGELRDGSVGGLGQVELREQVVAGAVGLLGGQSLQATEQPQVLAGRQVLVDRRVLTGDADQLPHRVALTANVVAEDPRLAAVDRQQRRQHVQHHGLAGTVRAEHAEDLTFPDGEVDVVHGAVRAERLRQAAGLDSRVLSNRSRRCRLQGSGADRLA